MLNNEQWIDSNHQLQLLRERRALVVDLHCNNLPVNEVRIAECYRWIPMGFDLCVPEECYSSELGNFLSKIYNSYKRNDSVIGPHTLSKIKGRPIIVYGGYNNIRIFANNLPDNEVFLLRNAQHEINLHKSNLLGLCQRISVNTLPFEKINNKQLEKMEIENILEWNSEYLLFQLEHGCGGEGTCKIKKCEIEEFVSSIANTDSNYICTPVVPEDEIKACLSSFFWTSQDTLPEIFDQHVVDFTFSGASWPASVSKEVLGNIRVNMQILSKKIAEIGFEGIFGVDFLLTSGDNLLVVDINLRPTATFFAWFTVENFYACNYKSLSIKKTNVSSSTNLYISIPKDKGKILKIPYFLFPETFSFSVEVEI